MPSLNKLLKLIKDGIIRNDIGQASGWLIIIGAEEYHTPSTDNLRNDGYDWKVGAYEPTTGQHGDIDYLYTVDLENKTIDVKEV